MNTDGLSPEDAEIVNMAAMAGVTELADQVRRLGLSGGEDLLEDAARMRPVVLWTTAAVKAGESPEDAAARLWEEVSTFAICEAGHPGKVPSVEELAVALAASYNTHPGTAPRDPRYDYAAGDATAEAAWLREALLKDAGEGDDE